VDSGHTTISLHKENDHLLISNKLIESSDTAGFGQFLLSKVVDSLTGKRDIQGQNGFRQPAVVEHHDSLNIISQ